MQIGSIRNSRVCSVIGQKCKCKTKMMNSFQPTFNKIFYLVRSCYNDVSAVLYRSHLIHLHIHKKKHRRQLGKTQLCAVIGWRHLARQKWWLCTNCIGHGPFLSIFTWLKPIWNSEPRLENHYGISKFFSFSLFCFVCIVKEAV